MGDAGFHAGWDLSFGHAVDTKGALFHHVGLGIELGHPVRAGPGAIPASDATVFVDEDDPVFLALGDGANRACRLACRFASMHARHGYEIDAQIRLFPGIGEFAFFDLDDPVEVKASGSVIFGLASHGTCMAPDTVLQIHPECILLGSFLPERPLD